ncbi:MAG: hypothetical protein V4726_08890 [Verrucomicrobiota bacterium]
MKKIILSPVVLALLGSLAGAAKVDITRNSAKAGGTKLKAGAEVGTGADIITGSKSKLQLSVGDRGGVYRAGSLTDAVLTSEQSLSLKKGILLSSSGGKGFSRESLSVETPEVRSTVKGTMLVAYQPEAYIKITCVEGRVTVKLKAALGEFVTLKAGQMVIINPADKGLPESVEVDLKELAATSALLNGDFPALGAGGALAQATGRQERAVRGGDLAATNLRLSGAGPTVSVEAGIEGQRVEPPQDVKPPQPPDDGNGNEDDDDDGGDPLPETPVIPEPPKPKDGYVIDSTTVFAPPALTTPAFPTITGTVDEGTFYHFPAGLQNPALTIRGNVTIPASSGGTYYMADGLMKIGDGDATFVDSEDDLSFSALVLQLLNAQISSSTYDLAFNAEDVLGMAGSRISGGTVDLYGKNSVSLTGTEITGNPDLNIISGGGISIVNSTLKGTSALQVGNSDPLSSGVISISGGSLLSSDGVIQIYSNAAAPDADSIVISDSTITSTYASSGNLPSLQIGNDDQSGAQFTGGIRFLNAQVTGTGSVGVQTGMSTSANSGPITVDKSTLRSSGGSVNVVNKGSNGDRIGIRVQNSSQLLALASSGAVRLTTNGSQIQVSNSTLSGGTYSGSTGGIGNGEVLIDAMAGASPLDTLVQLSSVTASADIIRARSYNSGDRDSLVITGGRYDAFTALKFYAEGASKLRFAGNVTINTPNADFAGKIVQVDSGGAVTSNGRITVYADDHRYNVSGGSYGTIQTTSGGEPGRSKFTERPGF